ncbi:hypothetical protein F4Y59_06980 [Candidatus Poribacteria bacterium]|nr:hypothetical protein [Candidatus Poribacteria bacterium]MYK20365.1 hypothetical protein [Candidatus Poribacteria bacterium]
MQTPETTEGTLYAIGKPGQVATYEHESEASLAKTVVKTLTLAIGSVEEKAGVFYQGLCLRATKASGEKFAVWLLSKNSPSKNLKGDRANILRYILQIRDDLPLEFHDRFTGKPVLPGLGAWEYLFPKPTDATPQNSPFPQITKYLGHTYRLSDMSNLDEFAEPPKTQLLSLRPDVLIGPPSNTRQKDETRRYDTSDYELVLLTEADYDEMIAAGINCVRVDAKQVKWVKNRSIFYWGIDAVSLGYPECLYRSDYLGPTIFMDEPAVCTRDHVLRPKLAADPEFRKALTPQIAFEAFRDHFHTAKYDGAPTRLWTALESDPDVDLGNMQFLQENLYTWETMISSAVYQLSEGNTASPTAIVFEPPGRVGTLRTLPEMNMTYGCQIPIDDPKNLASILYGFLRGAARQTDKDWGMSIYGQVHRADAFWLQTHAYDLGARHFHYWDNHQLACVPYNEVLTLSRNLSAHVESHPHRNLDKLRTAAEIAILLPPGYNLGHVEMGRGNLWGLGELNLERHNREGVKYRTVMHNFFIEIERAIRLGVAFDLLWDLEGLKLADYREVVRIREDGKVEVREGQETVLHEGARTPTRPTGIPPVLTVDVSMPQTDTPLEVHACATVIEGSAAVYYTRGADENGVYNNEMVLWELFGPEEEDYRFLNREYSEVHINQEQTETRVEIRFRLKRPGNYRLRAATVDMAGRTTVAWRSIAVTSKTT